MFFSIRWQWMENGWSLDLHKPKHDPRRVCTVHVRMSYSSPSRLGDRSFPSRVASSTHLDHWAFFSCPCMRIISINLQSNICEPLFISPYFFLLSPSWFGVCSLGLHQAAKSLQVPDVLLLCAEEQVVAGQQVDHSFQMRSILGKRCVLFQSYERSEQVTGATFTKMKTYTQKVV